MRFEQGSLDLGRRQWIGADGVAVPLSPLECELIRYLGEQPGVTVSRAELLENVWGYAPGVRSRAVDHTVRRLRQKLERPDALPLLSSVYGGGYRADGRLLERVDDPQPVSMGLIGRDADLERLKHALGDHRLVTLRGPGGVGKTSLVRAWLGTHPGVFVSLAQSQTLGQVLVAIAYELGVPLGSSPEESQTRLLARLSSEPLVLVLDNLEQVEEGLNAVLERWLSLAPDLRLVTTSRRSLGLASEHVLELAPLDEADGLELLTLRAQLVRPGFRPEGPVWGEVVRALDGLPLAIELCAPRVGMVAPEDLLQRLKRSLSMARGSSTQPRPLRQQALESSLEWSWSLLQPEEQRALVTLTQIPGAFDLHQAEAVVGTEDALDRIDALLDASLITRDPSGRMSLFVSVRTFAQQQGSSDDRLEAEDRRRQWLCAHAEQASHDWLVAHVVGIEVAIWRGLDRSPEEVAGLAHALHRVNAAVEGQRLVTILEAARRAVPQDSALGLALGLDLLETQRIRGLGDTDLEPALRAIAEQARQLEERGIEQRATRARGNAARGLGALEAARRFYEEAIALAQSEEDIEGEALSTDDLGLLCSRAGDPMEARRHHQRALLLFECLRHPRGMARSLGNLGKALRQAGRFYEAETALREALQNLPADMDLDRAVLLNNLANTLLGKDQPVEARASLLEATALFRRLGSGRKLANGLASLAVIEYRLGSVSAGERRALEALEYLEGARDALSEGWIWMVAGMGALLQEDTARAAERLDAAEPLLDRAGAEALRDSRRRLRALTWARAGAAEEVDTLLADDVHPIHQLADHWLGRRASLDPGVVAALQQDEIGAILLATWPESDAPVIG